MRKTLDICGGRSSARAGVSRKTLTAAAAIAASLLFVHSSLLAQIPSPGSEGKIQLQWLTDYPAALKKAGEEKKPLFIDITTDWCGWSKKMETETFSDKAVQKELRSFVLLRINPEASETNGKIAETYGADGYPTLVIANFKGEELGQESGYLETKDFLEYLRKYLPQFKGNPLGYKTVKLDTNDTLMKVMCQIPAPEARPTSEADHDN